ncbi:MAG: hypothetical protein H0X03_02290 [Nitrosopumilus sp.]|nr:hypothetical protein [Nitrosopumilus sp.]
MSCDSRNRSYKNGKTFDDCRIEARKNTEILSTELQSNNEISWNHVLEVANHDELVYKLTLKYLKEKGHDIGNYNIPRIAKSYNNI